MRTTCSLVLAAWCLVGTGFSQEVVHFTRDPEAAKKLLELPEASAEEYAQVEGTWELVRDVVATGETRRVKTHQGGKTTLTAYGPDGAVVSEHKSDYKLKKSGMARIFVYFKVVPATGPAKGRELPGPFCYAYNVQGDSFLEVYGILAGDDRSPRTFLWERVKK